jgi:hypothetical protein
MKNFPLELRHGIGAVMMLDASRLLLAFKKPQERKEAAALLKGIGFVLEDVDDEKASRSSRSIEIINHTDQRLWIRSANSQAIVQELFDAVIKIFARKLDWIGPVYRFPSIEGRGGLLCPLPNTLMIKPVPGLKTETLRALFQRLARLGLKEVSEKSKHLAGYHYYVIGDAFKQTAYQLQPVILKKEEKLVQEARFENMPMLKPLAVVPNDPLFPQQWNMTQIQAGGAGTTGWDISTGIGTVVVCVLDEGCDLNHPDLQFSTPGINLGTMLPDGGPTGDHGTACAGIVAAIYNNALGPAGVAGGCQIMPLAVQSWTDVEVAAGINYAANNGAGVISMSFGWDAWDHAIIDPAIQNAFNLNVVMCVATHNHNGAITYPATNPLVMACGASDQIDNRKSFASPDNESWGSDFGPEISVVAPGVFVPTTDRLGADGYNDNNGGPITWAGVSHAQSGDAAGEYFFWFDGTSAATPHVAGLAALIRSQYPALTNVQVRNIIERTAEKVGVVAYTETPGHPNGTWNQEMGYGRINVLHALDLSDVMIKDFPTDSGIEPSIPPGGDYWDFSDIAVRIFDDNVFVPDDPGKSSNVERGQTNYLYIRVTNNGPRDARNVFVDARITPYVGLQFVYPADWTSIDATHASPTPVSAAFPSIPAGTSVIAKFAISSSQVEDFWGWISGHSWHPCLLASVNADNDYAFAAANLAGGGIVVRRNNFAQRNLSVIDVLAGASASFPFIAGNVRNFERAMEIMIDRSSLPKDMRVLLSLDEDGSAFPRVDFVQPFVQPTDCCDRGTIFLERTRIETTLGCCRGILTLEKGSRFDCPPLRKIGKVSVEGGMVTLQGDRRFVEFKEQIAVIRIEKLPGQQFPLALQTSIPLNARRGQQFMVRISQRNEKAETVGGATACYYVA